MSAATEVRSSRPLWRQVLEDLEHRIDSGDIVDRFPTDRARTDHDGVRRHTVSEAVHRLRSEGLVDRHRGRADSGVTDV